MKQTLFVLLVLLLAVTTSFAQDTTGHRSITDSLQRRVVQSAQMQQVSDTIPLDYKPLHSPRKAAFYSAVLPGLGQIYNRQYWKLPIVYAAIGVSTGVFIFYMDKYKEFRDVYRIRKANANNPGFEKPYPLYSDENIVFLRDAYRQYVDYSVLVFVAAYALNIVDATVFAHLRQFDMSDDLSVRVSPTMLNARTPGISVKITLSPRKTSRRGLAFR